jgi:hypothetical protein
MDSLARKKRRQMVSIVVFAVLIVGLMVLHAARPSPEEKARASITETLLNRDGDASRNDEAGEQMRQQWQRLSPESRQLVFQEVARDRLDKFRAETTELNDDDRHDRITKAIDEMRERREDMSDADRDEARQRLQSEEGREAVANVMNFFQNGLTARERAEYDPLIHEWVMGMQEMIAE